MGSISVHQHSEVCAVSTDSQRGCSRCELLISLLDRECSPYCCPAALGQHDHGHTRSTSIGYRTSKQWTDEEDSCWKERELHQQHYVEEHHGTGILPVPCNLVSADRRKVVVWNQGRQFRSSVEHTHLQLLCVLPGVQWGELKRDGKDKCIQRHPKQQRVRRRAR